MHATRSWSNAKAWLGICVLFSLLDLGQCLMQLFSGLGSPSSRVQLKTQIVSLARETERGLSETPDQRQKMLVLFEKLEKLNPAPKSLASPNTSGRWSLEYTTSDSILGRGGFKRLGPIYQSIDVQKLTAENSEVVDYKLFRLSRSVRAELAPVSPSKVDVFFKQFVFGKLLKINAPSSFRGSLDITYVDEDLRLSRGDKGNIFVLAK